MTLTEEMKKSKEQIETLLDGCSKDKELDDWKKKKFKFAKTYYKSTVSKDEFAKFEKALDRYVEQLKLIRENFHERQGAASTPDGRQRMVDAFWENNKAIIRTINRCPTVPREGVGFWAGTKRVARTVKNNFGKLFLVGCLAATGFLFRDKFTGSKTPKGEPKVEAAKEAIVQVETKTQEEKNKELARRNAEEAYAQKLTTIRRQTEMTKAQTELARVQKEKKQAEDDLNPVQPKEESKPVASTTVAQNPASGTGNGQPTVIVVQQPPAHQGHSTLLDTVGKGQENGEIAEQTLTSHGKRMVKLREQAEEGAVEVVIEGQNAQKAGYRSTTARYNRNKEWDENEMSVDTLRHIGNAAQEGTRIIRNLDEGARAFNRAKDALTHGGK